MVVVPVCETVLACRSIGAVAVPVYETREFCSFLFIGAGG